MTDDVRQQLHDSQHQLVTERVGSFKELENERWMGHREKHDEIATALASYKIEANEWRGTLGDLRATFLPSAEYDIRSKEVERRLSALEQVNDRQQGRSEGVVNVRQLIYATLGIIVSIIGTGVAILTFVGQ